MLENPLSALNVSANTKLKKLFVSNTNLTSLDATNNTALATFVGKDCSYNIAVEGDGKFDLTLCRENLTQAKQLLQVTAQSMEISLRLIPIPRRSATIMISDKTTKK